LSQSAIVEQIAEVKEVKSQDYGPISDSENVKRFVTDYFSDIPILARIAGCESHYRHLTKSGEILRGVENRYDFGVMQINILYHDEDAKELGLNLRDLDDNVAFARHLYERQGAKPWMSSSACWAKVTESEIARR
jgi:hypothetical protein